MSLLRLENVVQRYTEHRTGRTFEALRVHALDIEPGEILTVAGPNGSGKSTLLETAAFLHRPDEGRVLLEGQDAWALGQALDARRKCPMLLQQTVLFSASVLKNAAYGLRARGIPSNEASRRAQAALELVAMGHLAHRRHNELSGGERRRVALARLLALESPVIVLDEPTAGLDRESEAVMEDLIRNINRERGTTLIMASHNFRQAAALSTRIVTVIDGKLIPEPLDNLFTGTMRKTAEGFEFTERRGWTHVFRANELAQDPWEGVGPADGPVQIGIPSSAVTVQSGGGIENRAIRGTIDSVRQDVDRYRLRIRLDQGIAFHAEVTAAEWQRLALNIGSPVFLQINPATVLVLPVGCDLSHHSS